MKNILVTGGAGFIGSNFIIQMLGKYSDYRTINLDALTYAGNLRNLETVNDNKNYIFIHGNICDKELVKNIFQDYDIDIVINFAAESHVDRSIDEPEVFIETNVLGTQILLDTAKKHWKVNPDDKYSSKYKEGVKFIQISTDEVYGALGDTGKFTEDMPLSPNSPYSASKASADLLALSYHKTYGFPVNITRCSNNYGPHQFPEKLIPLMINNARNNKPLPVYGDGMQVRDWLHVNDHVSAIDTVLHSGKSGEIYNIGGNNERTNLVVTKLILYHLGKSEKLIQHIIDRLGHDRRYAIDNSKITSELGWQPEYTFNNGLKDTIDWYINNPQWIDEITSGEYKSYYEKMYGDD